jgi:ribosomal-protein-serine acetyltransferase
MSITRPFLHDLPAEWVSPRIVLRRWHDADAQPLYDAIMESQAHLRPWLPWADTYHTVDDAFEYIRRQSGHWALRKEIGMGIFDRSNGRVLGGSGFQVHDYDVPAFEIGYWLRQSVEGRGYMSEAVRTLTTFLFDGLDAQRVMIRCDARNVRSKAIPERLGYRFEGCLRRDSIDAAGSVRDTLVYAMIPEDFARARETWT